MASSSPHDSRSVLLNSPDGPSSAEWRPGRALRGLLLLFGVCALIASYLGAGWVQDAASDLRHHQLAERTQVTATLLESASNQAQPDASQPVHGTTQVPARWHSPAGGVSTALLAVPISADAGDERTIWVDRSGELATPPLGPREIALLAILAGLSANAAGAALLFAAYRFHQHRAWQRRLRAWEAEWAEVAPQWTSSG